MMAAPENVGGPLRSPESSPLESQFCEVRKCFEFFWPDLMRGAQIIYLFAKQPSAVRYTLYIWF
jgi:hypothetical protein